MFYTVPTRQTPGIYYFKIKETTSKLRTSGFHIKSGSFTSLQIYRFDSLIWGS